MILNTDGWEKTSTGDPSNSGTTVSCALLQQGCIYVANVGDSSVVCGKYNRKYGKNGKPEVIAKLITKCHKPEDKTEKFRIESLGGKLATDKKGVTRVVWQRSYLESGIPCVQFIPYLNVSRGLGDLWSATKDYDYLISPIPDVKVFIFDKTKHSFIILASDGIWDVLSPQEAVNIVADLHKKTKLTDIPKILITNAMERWDSKSIPADNISVIVMFFNITASETETSMVDCDGDDLTLQKNIFNKRPPLNIDDILQLPDSKRLCSQV